MTFRADYIINWNVKEDMGPKTTGKPEWLTNDQVAITACSLTCTPAAGRVPPSVDISLEARGANQTGVEGAIVTAVTKIFLRTY